MRLQPFQHLRFLTLVVAPVALGLAFALSTGPQIQTYLFSLLNTDVPSVYGSAYQESLIEFPSLKTWLRLGFEWNFQLMALLIAVVVVQRSEPRLIAWRAALTSFLVLCIFDFGLALFHNQLTLKGAAENAVANLVGGALIAAILITNLSISDFLHSNVPVDTGGRAFIAACSALLFGLSISCLVYYLTDLFYNPLPVKYEAYVSPPASGVVAPKSDGPSSTDEKEQRFSFLPTKAVLGNAVWKSGESTLKVELLPANNGRKYQVSLTPLSGCSTSDEVKNLGQVPPWLVVNEVDIFEVSFDPGLADFFTMNEDSQFSSFNADAGKVGMFSMDQDSQSKKMKVTQFVGKDASLKLSSRVAQQSFVLSAPVLKMTSKEASLSPRILTLKLGTQTYSLLFNPTWNARGSDKVTCSVAVQGQSKTETGLINVGPVNFFAGVLAKVTRKEEASFLGNENMELRVSGAGGWLGLNALQPDELENSSLGALGMFQVRGNLSDLIVDGSPTSTRPIETYTAIGDFQAAYGNEAKLRVTGRAKHLWKDQSRMNPTKWEKLGWEAKVFILGILGSAMAVLYRFLAQCLRMNKRFAWLD